MLMAADTGTRRNGMATTTKIEWKKLKGGTLERANPKYDFVISRGGEGTILDVFEAGNPDSDDAYIDSLPFDSADEAKAAAEEFKPKNNLPITRHIGVFTCNRSTRRFLLRQAHRTSDSGIE